MIWYGNNTPLMMIYSLLPDNNEKESCIEFEEEFSFLLYKKLNEQLYKTSYRLGNEFTTFLSGTNLAIKV